MIEEKITKTMMHNYFKAGIIEAPIKKRYARKHLAGAIVVGVFKKLFEISKSGVGKLRQTLKLPSLYWCAAVVHSFSRADDIFPTS